MRLINVPIALSAFRDNTLKCVNPINSLCLWSIYCTPWITDCFWCCLFVICLFFVSYSWLKQYCIQKYTNNTKKRCTEIQQYWYFYGRKGHSIECIWYRNLHGLVVCFPLWFHEKTLHALYWQKDKLMYFCTVCYNSMECRLCYSSLHRHHVPTLGSPWYDLRGWLGVKSHLTTQWRPPDHSKET